MTSLESLFKPRSVAVIGASAQEQKVGYAVLSNMKQAGYKGKLYPINLKEEEILGYKCYKTIAEVAPVDLAVVCIPTKLVLSAVEECGQAGVKHVVIITAGFKEVGPEGAVLEQKVQAICEKYNMTVTGPNCLGILSTHDNMNASFGPLHPPTGGIAFISQSGALGAALLDWCAAANIGLSRFTSMGNKAGLTETDFLVNFGEDPGTKVIICYLESIADGPGFMDALRNVSLHKPVIILKSGVGQAAQRAASSHTGSLAGNDQAYDTAIKQCGGIRVQGMQEFLDLATAFSLQPVPEGNRMALVTNAGGPGIVCTDAVERAGNLVMTSFDPATVALLREKLPAVASVANPVDVVGDAGADRYAIALEPVLRDPNVDAVIVLVSPQSMTAPMPTAVAVKEVLDRYSEKPVLSCWMGGDRVAEAAVKSLADGIPSYTAPEQVAVVASGMAKYAAIRQRGKGTPVTSGNADKEAVKAIIDSVRKDGRTALLGFEAAAVVEAYGVEVAAPRLAKSADEAATIAEKVGYPIALKIASPNILHKSDVGGVKLSLMSAGAVRDAFTEMMAKCSVIPDAKIYGIEVQRMMPKGVEVILGMVRDKVFGPMIMFGMGGIYVNLIKDVSFRLSHGLTKEDVSDMVRDTKAYTLLKGYRGEAASDIAAVENSISCLAALVNDFPEIEELDINPLFVYGKGSAALDVKVTLVSNNAANVDQVVGAGAHH